MEYPASENIGLPEPTAVPAEVDYDMWVGPAEMVPFQTNRFHSDWHWWYNFGTGDIGNDGAHEYRLCPLGIGRRYVALEDRCLGR